MELPSCGLQGSEDSNGGIFASGGGNRSLSVRSGFPRDPRIVGDTLCAFAHRVLVEERSRFRGDLGDAFSSSEHHATKPLAEVIEESVDDGDDQERQ
jgi:hypothetical protein